MASLLRVLHTLAIALWFGMGIFFTFVVGLSLFATFEKRTSLPPEERPLWLPAAVELEKPSPSARFPSPLRKEQGSRIAGAAVGPLFTPYYGLQVGCGVIGVVTVLGFPGGHRRTRGILLVLALAGAGFGWWLEKQVEDLRVVRETASDRVLRAETPNSAELEAADQARATFGLWHTYSLLANFATLALVMALTILLAFLPPPVAAVGSYSATPPTPK